MAAQERDVFEQMAATGAETPAFVQNRCFARAGWDRDVRSFCRERKIVYQGFSLLTANPEVLRTRWWPALPRAARSRRPRWCSVSRRRWECCP